MLQTMIKGFLIGRIKINVLYQNDNKNIEIINEKHEFLQLSEEFIIFNVKERISEDYFNHYYSPTEGRLSSQKNTYNSVYKYNTDTHEFNDILAEAIRNEE